MNFTLLKTNFKKYWALFLIFSGVLSFYVIIIIMIFDPDQIESLMSMVGLMPPDLMKAMGFITTATDLTGFIASWLYGFLMFGFPMVYCIILGNNLVSKMVDNGSFSYLLSTPNSRERIIITQGAYSLLSIGILFCLFYLVGLLTCRLKFPGMLDIKSFFKLNITTMLVNMTVMMINFFFSCLFNDSRLSTGFGTGIPIIFLLMYMMGGVSEKTEFVRKLSIYGFYNPLELVRGIAIRNINLLYIMLIMLLFTASILIFRKKRLPL